MEELQPSPTTEPEQAVCSNCGHPATETGQPNLLCSDCRLYFQHFPVPRWIMWYAVAIGVIIAYSLIFLPGNFNLAIHLERGKKAEKEKKFFTAQRELERVVQKIPNNVEATGHLAVAAFYNQDFITFGNCINQLKDATIEDHELFASLEDLIDKANSYFADSSFANFRGRFPETVKIPDSAWTNYFSSHSEDVYALNQYASYLLDDKKYGDCDSITNRVLSKENDCFPTLILKAALKREEGNLDESMHYCDLLLDLNKESVMGMAAKARTLLAMKKDKQALELATKSYQMDPKNYYCLGSLILADHFNNRLDDRDALIKKGGTPEADSSGVSPLKYVLDVIQGKEKFRD
jgi:tetratricopeptide (TPR) repeat protein